MMADHNEITTDKTYRHGFNNTNDAERELLNPKPPSYSFDDQNKTQNRNWTTVGDEKICSSIQPARPELSTVSYAPHPPYQDNVFWETRQGFVNSPQPVITFVAIEKPLVVSQNVRSHFALSVIVALCCCLPIGICAIAFSHKAKVSLAKGNYRSAKTNSKWALSLNITGIILGIIFTVVFIYFKALNRNGK